MRIHTFSIVSALFVGLAACNGGGGEDCGDNTDNDGDAAVDCDDSECATDAACSDTNDTTDTTDTNTGPEICDDADGEDEDGDDDANCADSDCAGISDNCNEIIGFVEIGEATISTDSWSGTGSQGWEVYDLDATSFINPARTGCHATYTSTGVVHANAADCTDCEFAFEVTFNDTQAESGDACATLTLDDENGNPFNLDNNAYGYGYNPAYDYQGTDYAVLMYFYDGAWVVAGADITRSGDDFAYSYVFSELYYY